MTNSKLIRKDFPFSAFAFEREKDGKTYTTYSVSRAYKNTAGAWDHQSISLCPEELLKLANICMQTYNSHVAKQNAYNASVPTKSAEPQANDGLDDDIPF